MKAIIIGASLSGKTAVVRHLRLSTDIPVSEMDEELTQLNDGKYPTDNEYKHNVLAPKIINNVLNRESIIFFTNTDYFSLEDFQQARNKGFKIIQIEVGLNELLRRNKQRVDNEGHEDLSKWLKGMVGYQKKVREAGLVDEIIQGSKPVKKVAREIEKILYVK